MWRTLHLAPQRRDLSPRPYPSWSEPSPLREEQGAQPSLGRRQEAEIVGNSEPPAETQPVLKAPASDTHPADTCPLSPGSGQWFPGSLIPPTPLRKQPEWDPLKTQASRILFTLKVTRKGCQHSRPLPSGSCPPGPHPTPSSPEVLQDLCSQAFPGSHAH